MTADDFSSADLQLLSLLAGADAGDRLVNEILEGFSADRAALLLDSAEHFAQLAELITSITPGRGWYRTAARSDETGRLNRRLLLRAELVRTRPAETHHVVREDQHTTLTSLSGRVDDVSSATVALPGGQVTWDCADPTEITSLAFDRAVPQWLTEVLGSEAADAVVSGAAAVEVREQAGGAMLARYALADWLHRRHPGTGDPRRRFPEAIHRIETGTLAWQAETLLGSTLQAADWLAGAGTHIVALHGRIQAWTGWRRTLADRVVEVACDAFLDAWPAATDAGDVRRLRNALVHADAEAGVLDYAGIADRELALVAGHSSGGDIVRSGGLTVDPLLVPPRSVHAVALNARWELVEGDELELVVRAASGDSPVPMIEATAVLDGAITAFELPHGHEGYRGAMQLAVEPETIEVHVHGLGIAGPFRDPASVEETRRQIEAVLSARRDVFDGLLNDDGSLRFMPSGPFLAELICWRPEL